MTGRTHDLAAFTALNFVVATHSLPSMTLATAIIAFSANMIGGLAPDIDQPTATLWHRIRGGSFIARFITPLLGGHRFISHSLLGIFLFGFLLKFFLEAVSTILIVDMNIVWWSFMIGFISHLVMDTFSHEGVPWLFPIPIHFGFPPLEIMRPHTGGVVEKSFIFPVLLMINIYIVYVYYSHIFSFFHNIVK